MPFDSSYYAVGYGKPPVKTRFKKGQSGNPSGRPKAKPKTTTLGDEVEAAFNEVVGYEEENGRRRILTKRQLTALQIVNRSAMGDAKFIQLAEQFSPAAQDIADSPRPSPRVNDIDLSKLSHEDAQKMIKISHEIEAILAKARSNPADKKAPPPTVGETPR